MRPPRPRRAGWRKTAGAASRGGITLRPLSGSRDYAQCLALQRATWGQDFTERVPASLLMATQLVGGVAAGAFERSGRLLGFVFGVSGVKDGRPAHWSDMLAVRRDARDRGVGRRLKVYQRELLLASGIQVAYWTFDPLVARNAQLNLTRLGVRVLEYVPDFYGDRTQNTLARGVGTDRLVVEWDLQTPQPADARVHGREPRSTAARDLPVTGPDPAADLPDAPTVLVGIPCDVHQLVQRGDRTLAARWRAATRRAFLWYLGAGYRVTGFRRGRRPGRAAYVLTRPAERPVRAHPIRTAR